MKPSLDQLICQLEQVIQQLETLEAVFTVFPVKKQNYSQALVHQRLKGLDAPK